MVRAIIFDCFGVLTVDTWHAYLDTLPPQTDLQPLRDLNRAVDAGFMSHQEFLDKVQALTGKPVPDIESVTGVDITKNTALLDHIDRLQPDFKIGLLSNISGNWVTRELLTPAEQTLFDDMVFSYQVGLTKPDPQIFTLACERLGVEPQEAIMVDDISNNVAAAQAVGMKGIVYTDFTSFKAQLGELLNTNH